MFPRGKLRPDLAVYRDGDQPEDHHGAFHVPPLAVVEILSEDAEHDLVRKDELYAQFGVTSRAYLDARQREGWWCRIDGADHTNAFADWQTPGWPALRLRAGTVSPPRLGPQSADT